MAKGWRSAIFKSREIDGGRYVTAMVFSAGKATPEVLGQALPGLIASLRLADSMRWNASNVPLE